MTLSTVKLKWLHDSPVSEFSKQQQNKSLIRQEKKAKKKKDVAEHWTSSIIFIVEKLIAN